MADSSKRIKELSSNDRMSQLPDEILCHILSYLTMVDSVATCILSPRWNGLWKHVSKDHSITVVPHWAIMLLVLCFYIIH
ncbi:hypothetical protein Leryth_013947 [Lithospermum erythrorhizon]|uniref:F-box domain-containing protein n=1 Tax=Lithospermum erythrorhizon TaxID=34254 RepID=A0AAV3Q208_LITER|nr:hypothetical protein Leryth_013947 [Lithospermum erythrorhizon]